MFSLENGRKNQPLAVRGRFLLTCFFVLATINSDRADSKNDSHIIEITGFEFKPKQLVVEEGDIITWVNRDIAPHNITLSNDQKIISPNLLTDQIFVYKVKHPFSYECGLHPSMTGKISVKRKIGSK